MGNIAYFNTLEPKQSYIDTVTKLLEKHSLTLTQIISKSQLTKTQIGCSLDYLIAKNKVKKTIDKNNKKIYSLTSNL